METESVHSFHGQFGRVTHILNGIFQKILQVGVGDRILWSHFKLFIGVNLNGFWSKFSVESFGVILNKFIRSNIRSDIYE